MRPSFQTQEIGKHSLTNILHVYLHKCTSRGISMLSGFQDDIGINHRRYHLNKTEREGGRGVINDYFSNEVL